MAKQFIGPLRQRIGGNLTLFNSIPRARIFNDTVAKHHRNVAGLIADEHGRNVRPCLRKSCSLSSASTSTISIPSTVLTTGRDTSTTTTTRTCSTVTNGNGRGQLKLDFSSLFAFQHKTTKDLLRGLVVLKLSSYEKFVDNSLKIMSVSQRILGQRLFEFVARCTFYGHFIAGNGEVEAKRLVKKFEEHGVATILAVTAEEDVGEDKGRYDEPRYDRNTNSYLRCMDLSLSLTTKFPPVSQLKLTTFAKADVLAKITDVLSQQDLYYRNDTPLSISNLTKGLDGKMDHIPDLTDAENIHLQLVLQRVNKICERAVKNKAKLLIDAEKTNINPGLTLLTLALMQKFNRNIPRIWNTYQFYLKGTFERLQKDLQWSESEGICFGVKIVRGAYMDSEKEYAMQHQMEDPINPSFDATSEKYNSGVSSMLTYVHKNPDRCNIIVATHNEDSVMKAVTKMEELGIDPQYGNVIFGQVMGISDQITMTLGKAGYLIYKSSPYGPLNDVLPYIARRAQENSSIFQNLRNERGLMYEELKRRMRFY